MPGNRELYEQEMNAGYESAWDQNWKAAANHYGRALQEFPDDPDAHLNLGFALLQEDRLDEALRVYSRAHQIAPNDPIPVEKSAEVLEKMGRVKESAQQYASVAEIYLNQRDIDKAVHNWEKSTTLTPGLVAIHAKLATAYRKIGDKRRAVYQYLMVAFNLSRSGDTEQAKKAAQRALALDKRNIETINAMAALDAGAEIKLPEPPQVNEDIPVEIPKDINWSGDTDLDDIEETIESDPLGPMGMAMNAGLTELAEHIMMSGSFDIGGTQALQAMERQRQGQHAEAIQAYREAASNLKHPALSINLGGLLLLSEQPADATSVLNEATQSETLKIGAYHALGQAYYRQDRFKRGVGFLTQAAQLVDSEQAKTKDEKQDVDTVYNAILQTIKNRSDNDQTLAAVCRRMMRLLSGKDWERRLGDVRYQMLESYRDGGGNRILEFLAEDIGEGVTESVAKIDRYIRHGLYILAMDEAQYAIEKAPTYLPIHVRMAEVMMLEGRVRQAINKYNVVARTYRVRGENGRAASILFEVLEMAPLDIDVRKNLIELLESEERWEETLDQYIDLAGTYHQLGNLETARVTYAEAERLAQRVGVPPEKMASIKHEIADVDQLRMDMRKAQRVYEEIITLVPQDERARRALIEINLQVGNQIESIKQLDELLRLYAKRKQVKNILKLLQELVHNYPDESGLRSRLAAIYRQLGRKEEAVEQLDKLANLQLDSGLTQDACDTIRQIVKLNPPNVNEFKAALQKLSC